MLTNPYIIALMRVAKDPSTRNLTEALTELARLCGTVDYEERRYKVFWHDRYGRRRSEYQLDWSSFHEPSSRYLRSNLTGQFLVAAQRIVGEPVVLCDHGCQTVMRVSVANTPSYATVCDDCLDKHYVPCPCCSELRQKLSMTEANGEVYCGPCVRTKFIHCWHCEGYFLRNEHDVDKCICDAPLETFTFPNGTELLANDERITVELPKGEISAEGIEQIIRLVGDEAGVRHCYMAVLIDEIGPQWQAKRGNFTKRLSSAVYKKHQHKMSKWLISEVGNVARAYSGDEASWNIEFTRRLNGTAAEFGNAGSCWWGRDSYGRSRCALKSWGGIGLRAFPDPGSWTGATVSSTHPTGRAWVQPLDENLQPTHNATKAFAYIVYNGYGKLQGYVAPRIVAQMAGMTYRKVEFYASPQYVNNQTGYLVGNRETCNNTDTVSFNDIHFHDRCDADMI